MNTNHDAFENDLRALQRRELPAQWRDEILSAAKTIKSASRTPRWLVIGWSAAWAAILMMYFTTPAEPEAPPHSVQTNPAVLWEERTALIEKLLASN
jgi:hypothetical protein